jgi:DNA-binding transcriptional ArsR family regulator
MPEHISVAPDDAHALADPIRIGIVAALADRRRTLDSLALQLDVSKERLSEHARVLETMGFVRMADEDPRAYELLRQPVVWDDAWSELPVSARREAIAASLAQIHAAATTALDSGGFDRPDINLTRTSVRLSEKQWCEIAEQFDDMLRRLDTADDDPNGVPATVVTMLFSRRPHRHTWPRHRPEVADDLLERVWALVEALDAETTGAPLTQWDRVERLADELRLAARSAARPAGGR